MSVFRKYVEKIQVLLKSDKNKGYLHEDQYTFFVISRSTLLRMKNVSAKSCRETRNKHFIFNNFVERGRPQMTWCMRITSWIPKATCTNTQAV